MSTKAAEWFYVGGKNINELEILDGPSRDRIIDSFKYEFDDSASIAVDFRIGIKNPDTNTTFVVRSAGFRILSIAHESESGGQYLLTGYAGLWKNDARCFKSYRFEAHYNTFTRNGWMKFYDC